MVPTISSTDLYFLFVLWYCVSLLMVASKKVQFILLRRPILLKSIQIHFMQTISKKCALHSAYIHAIFKSQDKGPNKMQLILLWRPILLKSIQIHCMQTIWFCRLCNTQDTFYADIKRKRLKVLHSLHFLSLNPHCTHPVQTRTCIAFFRCVHCALRIVGIKLVILEHHCSVGYRDAFCRRRGN